MTQYMLTQRDQGWCDSYWDYTLPADYVPGTGITINVTGTIINSATTPTMSYVQAFGVRVNGDWYSVAPVTDWITLNENGDPASTFTPGSTITLFCDRNDAAVGFDFSPRPNLNGAFLDDTFKTVSVHIPGASQSLNFSEAGHDWTHLGGEIVIDGNYLQVHSGKPPNTYTSGIGYIRDLTFGLYIPGWADGPSFFPDVTVPAGPYGGVVVAIPDTSAFSLAAGGDVYGPGDHITICLIGVTTDGDVFGEDFAQMKILKVTATAGSSTTNLTLSKFYYGYPIDHAPPGGWVFDDVTLHFIGTAIPPLFTFPSSQEFYLQGPPDTSLTFAEFKDPGYKDWRITTGGTDYLSFLDTWYAASDDTALFMEAPWVVTYLGNNEPVGTPSCIMTPRWEWTDADFAHRSGPATEIYIDRPGTVSDRRNRVRGKGRVLSLHYQSSSGQPFNLLGWSVALDKNTSV